jgi:hypothetical protein
VSIADLRAWTLLNCFYSYTGRNGALETHWKESHSHLAAKGQPFPNTSSRESAFSSKKPVKKSSAKLSWPSLDEILDHHKVALGEHPVNPSTDHAPIPYPPSSVHTMRHSGCLNDCGQYTIAQAAFAPLQPSSPVTSVASLSVVTPSTCYSQQLSILGPNPQYQPVSPLPLFTQCAPSLPEFAPPALPFMDNISMGPFLPFNSSPFSTLDGPWDFPVWNDPVQQDMLGGSFDFSMTPAPPMPLSNPFEPEGVWDQFPAPFFGGYF